MDKVFLDKENYADVRGTEGVIPLDWIILHITGKPNPIIPLLLIQNISNSSAHFDQRKAVFFIMFACFLLVSWRKGMFGVSDILKSVDCKTVPIFAYASKTKGLERG